MTTSDDVRAVAALDEPTRRRLYDYVAAARRPVGRDEAARDLGVARVTAAFHLDRLAADGLLEVTRQRLTGRSGPGAGRPAKLYGRAGRDVEVCLPPRHYDLAAMLLAEAVELAAAHRIDPRDALARRAREHGATLGRGTAETIDPVDILADAGFEPFRDGDVVRLANCPFHRLARAHTELVCGMNLRLIEGLLAARPGAGHTAELDPGPDRCCVALRLGTESPAT